MTETAGVVTIVYENVSITTLPHGFTLGRRGTSLRDLSNNDPVDHANPDNEVGNNEPLDSEAIGGVDRMNPRITLTADTGMIPTSTDFQYEMTFTITADETVTGIGTTASYALVHIDSSTRTVVTPVSTNRISGDMNDGDSATFTYTVQLVSLADVRATEGYTLALASDALRDLIGNLPVKSDDTALYNTAGTTRIGLGELAPISDGTVDSTAVAARDTTPPTLTVVAGDLTTNADFSYDGSFIVSVEETIENIGVATSYELLRVPLSGIIADYNNATMITTTLMPSSVTTNSAVISFTSVTLANAEEARGTYGFILGIASSAELRDRSGNDITVIENTAEGAEARIEKVSPQITITTDSL